MKKIIVANTLGMAVFLSPLFHCETAKAQSSVSLYGIADTWFGSEKDPGAQRMWGEGAYGMSTSYWGLKGSEDLGNDIKAVFALESFFRMSDGDVGRFDGDSFFGRNAYVGLQSSYGTVVAGRLATQLFVSNALFNPFADSFNFSPMQSQTYLGLGFASYKTDQGVIGDTEWNNAVSYSSPDFNGLSGGAMYSFGDTAGAGGSHKDSAQVLYFHGPFSASVVYQYANYFSAAGDASTFIAGMHSQSVGQISVAYDFKLLKLYSQYMLTRNAVSTGYFNVNTGQLGVSVPISVGSLLASYAYSRDAGGIKQTRNTWAIDYDYPLSKKTDVYVNYLSDRVSGLSSGDTFGVGIRAKF